MLQVSSRGDLGLLRGRPSRTASLLLLLGGIGFLVWGLILLFFYYFFFNQRNPIFLTHHKIVIS